MSVKGGKKLHVGLMGTGIQASRSPALHMGEAQALGLNLDYELIDFDSLPAAQFEAILGDRQKKGYLGVNVTHPFKQSVIAFLDELSPDAKAMGAVNTVVFKEGRRIGHNTDWSGYAEGFRRGLRDVPHGHVVQMGAGGAGAAVAYALLKLGAAHLTLFDPDSGRCKATVTHLGKAFSGRIVCGTDLPAAMAQADGLVNCTPVGMAKYPGMPLPENLLRPTLWVSEVIYFPLETELLTKARALGCQTLDGSPMNIFQGAQAFELFTGLHPDAERMLARFS
jgi:shikimate dehydrogenase